MIRRATPADAAGILTLYRAVAARPGGLARLAHEVTAEYVAHFMLRSAAAGLQLVAEDTGAIVGEIHAYGPGLQCFAHVLSELTIAVSPAHQGTGIGRRLFAELLRTVGDSMPRIQRVELIARESNAKAIAFYESLGFVVEGRLRRRVGKQDGSLEDDVTMGWLRPT